MERGTRGERAGAGRPAVRWVSSTEVRPGHFVPVTFPKPLSLDLAPAVTLTGLGLPHRTLVKATVICLLDPPFGTCGEGPTDTVNSVSVLVLAILKVTFGKSEKSECLSYLAVTPSSCFVNWTLVIMPSAVYLQLRLP